MSDLRQDLLVEIGTEELPPAALQGLSTAFASGFEVELAERGIAHAGIEPFASPRRLAVLVSGIAERQPDRESLRRGPALSSAFGADGSPSKAAEGFARSCGLTVAELGRETTEKGEWLCHRSIVPGQPTLELVAEVTERALAGLPIPKRMRWGSGQAEFVRPVHWVCGLLGSTPVPGTVLGVACGRETWGHRFHRPGPIALALAADYPRVLREQGQVEPSFARRRAMVLAEIEALALKEGIRPQIDDWLLDEVTALVEWPKAILGGFEESFLEVPPEVLIETMQKNQKYFPVRRPGGELDARFVAVANIDSRDPAQVRAGNERVVRPRFSDAKFFWEHDLAHPLGELFERLERVVFQERLGSLADKSRRVVVLSGVLAERPGAQRELVERAAYLAKCDLVSSMVFEFPALQGIMGRYYAERAGEDRCVCEALDEQYLPRFAGDRLPGSSCGLLVGIADRLDTLVGIFGIGQRPTGTKDPYGLRRASIAVLRMTIETPLTVDLRWALGLAVEAYPPGTLESGTADAVLVYVLDRLAGYYQEQGIGADLVDAVLATGETVPELIDRRIRALEAFRSLPAAESLAAATKRIRNILSKADFPAQISVDRERLVEPAEIALCGRIDALHAEIQPLLANGDFGSVLGRLAGLREDVDRFFDEVMVMAEDPAVRRNRLALLDGLARLFLQVADISRLQ